MLSEDEIKSKLSDEQYKVLRERGTERPFSGKALIADKDGNYLCAVCGSALFSHSSKFDSGTGWPSFDEALPDAVLTKDDNNYGMSRVEVLCAKCHSHLGHLFDDGPTKTGKRYCTNSVCFEDFREK